MGGLSCSVACSIFLDQGSYPCLLHWQGGFFTTEPPGKPWMQAMRKSKDFGPRAWKDGAQLRVLTETGEWQLE